MSRICCFALFLALAPSVSWAQGDALTELYGEGVHRYFAGDYAGADQILTQVVDGGSQDPRAHYFRGLAREMSGFDGVMDFESGARLEVEGKRAYDVGMALTRVQGHVRTQIEKARRDARVSARQQQLLNQESRMQAMPAPGSSPMPPPPSDTADDSDPFAGEGMRSGDSTLDDEQPTVPDVDATTNPFADDTAPAGPAAGTGPGAGTSPFGEPGDTAPAGNPFEAGDAPAAGNPFDSGPAPAAGNPFETPAAGDAPAGDAPAGGNPFDSPF